MLVDVTEVRALDGTKLYLRFEDGASGTIDISAVITFTGVFEPLKAKDFFDAVRVNHELGTIYWPNGADLCQDVLYSKVTGKPIPDFIHQTKRTG
jgi:hypothetical protein